MCAKVVGRNDSPPLMRPGTEEQESTAGQSKHITNQGPLLTIDDNTIDSNNIIVSNRTSKGYTVKSLMKE